MNRDLKQAHFISSAIIKVKLLLSWNPNWDLFSEAILIDWTSEMKELIGEGHSFIFSIRDDSSIVKLKCLKEKNEI